MMLFVLIAVREPQLSTIANYILIGPHLPVLTRHVLIQSYQSRVSCALLRTRDGAQVTVCDAQNLLDRGIEFRARELMDNMQAVP